MDFPNFDFSFDIMWISILLFLYFTTIVWAQENITCTPYNPGDYVMNARVPKHCEEEILNCTRSWKAGISFGSSTSLPLIDPNFILCHEGFYTCLYVPLDSLTGNVLGSSGVHIGGGVDLGLRDRAALASFGVPSEILNILDSYLQIQSGEAACAVIDRPLSLTYDQALTLTNAVTNSIVSLAQARYEADRKGGAVAFTSLPKGIRTAIVDIWYHLGTPDNYPDIWAYVVSNNWEEAIKALRSYYLKPTQEQILDVRRRHNEADIISATLEECERSADIVFLLDDSGSIANSDYTLALNFIKQIINAFSNETLSSEKGTRFALSVFGSTYREQFKLNAYKSSSEYADAISAVSKTSGSTYLGRALDQIVEDQFNESYGLRPESLGFPKILVILTDGRATDSIAIPSENVRNQNIVIYAIGIGGYDRDQLNTIASSPIETHVFLLASFSDLSIFAGTLTASTCYEPQPISLQLTIIGQILQDEFQYFEFQINIASNLLVVVIDFSGRTLLFASRDTPHPYEHDNDFGVLSSSSPRKEIVISPTAPSTGLRRSSHVNFTSTIYVSVKGTSSNNTFTLVGSTCDPSVCKQGASDASAVQVSIALIVMMGAILLNI